MEPLERTQIKPIETVQNQEYLSRMAVTSYELNITRLRVRTLQTIQTNQLNSLNSFRKHLQHYKITGSSGRQVAREVI